MGSRLSPPVLYGICIGMGLALASQYGSQGARFRPELVQCYAGGPASSGTSTSTDTASPEPGDTVAIALARARAAASRCRSGSCDRETRFELRHSLAAYLAQRRAVTNALYEARGPAGLDEAARLFSTDGNLGLADDLTALFAKGVLSFEDLPEERPALALVLTKPVNAFKPCQALRQAPSTAAPYVY